MSIQRTGLKASNFQECGRVINDWEKRASTKDKIMKFIPMIFKLIGVFFGSILRKAKKEIQKLCAKDVKQVTIEKQITSTTEPQALLKRQEVATKGAIRIPFRQPTLIENTPLCTKREVKEKSGEKPGVRGGGKKTASNKTPERNVKTRAMADATTTKKKKKATPTCELTELKSVLPKKATENPTLVSMRDLNII